MATNEAGETLKHYEVKVYGENPASLKTCCLNTICNFLKDYDETCLSM